MTETPTSATPGKAATVQAAKRDPEHGRQANSFWEIPAAGWWDVLKRAYNESNADNVGLLAAGVAFYSFLAFVPMLAAIVLIYGLVADPSDVVRHFDTMLAILPKDAAKIVAEQMTTLTSTPPSKGVFGLLLAILLAIYGAMRGASSMITALNVTNGERETRGIIATTLLSFAMTVGVILSAIVAAVAIAAMGLVGSYIHIGEPMTSIVKISTWLATAIMMSALIAAVYRFGPDRERAQWVWLTPGSVFASVGSLLGTVAFGYYVTNFGSYNATYGALGAVVTFLMWLYVASYVVLMGSELNAELEHQTAKDTTDGPPKPLGARGAEMADHVAGLPGDVKPDGMAAGSSEEPVPPPPPPPRIIVRNQGGSTARTAMIFGGLGLVLGKHRVLGTGLLAAGAYALRNKKGR